MNCDIAWNFLGKDPKEGKKKNNHKRNYKTSIEAKSFNEEKEEEEEEKKKRETYHSLVLFMAVERSSFLEDMLREGAFSGSVSAMGEIEET